MTKRQTAFVLRAAGTASPEIRTARFCSKLRASAEPSAASPGEGPKEEVLLSHVRPAKDAPRSFER